ncbi:hypothetical protein OJ996_21620 [Luteolibacter sp. GHJ8]|jgi:hypothetical protein|uniref:Lipoprotein n=1 Tax=Luteolibacter rhizosphaerae TaxID=2989719 RepID=A0ABT3G8M5_9BACT|nr:hypothetical protein [Luteolibacter rhizosphaerae]MCW1916204.1 hypothetical protein [Luteolibacter rhizosphaerae]
MKQLAKKLTAVSGTLLLTCCGGDLGGGWTWDWDPVGSAVENRRENRRASEYESRGADPDKAARMAHEDQVWGQL